MCQKFSVQLNSKAIKDQDVGQNVHELEVCDESNFSLQKILEHIYSRLNMYTLFSVESQHPLLFLLNYFESILN